MMVADAIQRVHQISIRAADTARAVAFYRDVLGLKLIFQAPPQLAFFDCGGVRLMLGPAEPEFDHQGSVIYFAVDDIKRRAYGTRGGRSHVPHRAAPDREAARPRSLAD